MFLLSVYKKIIYKLIDFMSRYRGPKLKISRRLGTLPGLTTKNQIRLIVLEKMEMLMPILIKS
jgi:hypothetical protein